MYTLVSFGDISGSWGLAMVIWLDSVGIHGIVDVSVNKDWNLFHKSMLRNLSLCQ